VFVPVRPFQPSLMFAGEAKPGTKHVLHLGRLRPYKYLIRLEKLARDKHSILLGTFVKYGRKKLYDLGPYKVKFGGYLSIKCGPRWTVL
jgi:hypothetical protein